MKWKPYLILRKNRPTGTTMIQLVYAQPAGAIFTRVGPASMGIVTRNAAKRCKENEMNIFKIFSDRVRDALKSKSEPPEPRYIKRMQPKPRLPAYMPSKHMGKFSATKAYADGRQKSEKNRKPRRKQR